MTEDGWLEPRTRIPFVGIVAIVLIVAVVAIFIKTQLGPFFPASEITIQTEQDTTPPAITGRASSSFAGIREIPLMKKERMQGIATTATGTRIYTIDTPNTLLTITEGDSREEVILVRVGQDLIATFEYAGITTRVAVSPAERTMTYSEPGKSAYPTLIALSDVISYEGFFTFRNQRFAFQFSPSESEATITAAKQAEIPLSQAGTTYTGTWNDGKSSRPVTIDMDASQATIEEVY